jgi:hypothetical protein
LRHATPERNCIPTRQWFTAFIGGSSEFRDGAELMLDAPVQWHGVNQFLASRNIHGSIQANWFALFVKAILSLRLSVGSLWLAASECRSADDPLLFLIMRRTPRIHELIVLTLPPPPSLSSRPADGLSALAPAQRAGAQRLCALAHLRSCAAAKLSRRCAG